MTGPLRVYVAGAYSAPSRRQRSRNVQAATRAARMVVEMGAHPVVPHLVGFACEDLQDNWAWWMAATSRELSTCDLCVVVPGWELSRGTQAEIRQCTREQRPIFHLDSDRDVELLRKAINQGRAA